MLSVQRKDPSKAQRTIPNLLPCGVKHSGPIPTSSRYWAPRTSPASTTNGIAKPTTSTVYFRGRKLLGRHISIPATHQGVLLEKTDNLIPASTTTTNGVNIADQLRRMDEGEDDYDLEEGALDDGPAEVKTVEEKARFDEVVIWGHEAVPEDGDGFVKGIEEWMGFADAMHSYTDQPAPPT